MGSILGPYAPEWIWMCPYFKRVMVRMCSEPPGRIWEVLVGSRKNGKSDGGGRKNKTEFQEEVDGACQGSVCGCMGGDRSVS